MVKLIMELEYKSIDELELILKNIDSIDLIEYIKLLNKKSRKLFYKKLEKILGRNYVKMIKLSLSNRIKNNIIIIIITFFMFLFDFIIYPLSENIIYFEMIKENYFINAYLFPIFILKYFDGFWIGIPLLLMIVLLILINKKLNLFPYIFIYIFLLFIHLFIGWLIFGLRHGET